MGSQAARTMTTAIDSNVLVALWNKDDTLNTQARSALDTALDRGSLVVAAPVFAELLAAPGRSEAFLDSFCKETGIAVDWNLNEATCGPCLPTVRCSPKKTAGLRPAPNSCRLPHRSSRIASWVPASDLG